MILHVSPELVLSPTDAVSSRYSI